MQKNMYTIAHHAKLGKLPRISEMRELTNAINHASYQSSDRQYSKPPARIALSINEAAYNRNRDGCQCERVTNNVPKVEPPRTAVVVASFHFAQ